MENNIQKILLTEEQIQTRIQELGEVLSKEYEGKKYYGSYSSVLSVKTK